MYAMFRFGGSGWCIRYDSSLSKSNFFVDKASVTSLSEYNLRKNLAQACRMGPTTMFIVFHRISGFCRSVEMPPLDIMSSWVLYASWKSSGVIFSVSTTTLKMFLRSNPSFGFTWLNMVMFCFHNPILCHQRTFSLGCSLGATFEANHSASKG